MTTAEPSLLLFGADDARPLARQTEDAGRDIAGGAYAGHVVCARGTDGAARLRAAVLAGDPHAATRLAHMRAWLTREPQELRIEPGLCLGTASREPHIGFLFPGQGTVGRATVPPESVQRTIVDSSLAALRQMQMLEIGAAVAVGHSLGELTALHWAGALDESTLLRVVDVRGRLMSEHDGDPGAMVAVHADIGTCRALIDGAELTVACRNGPQRYVLSGGGTAIEQVLERASRAQVEASRLRTTGAFHSRLMERAAARFAGFLQDVPVRPPRRSLLSTVTGAELDDKTDLRALLARQICDPVNFESPARAAAARSDLLIELGPGAALARLVAEIADTPVVSIRTELRSRRGLLAVLGAAYAAGAAVRYDALELRA